MKLGDKCFVPFIPEADIIKRIKELGKEINQDYKNKSIFVIPILNGSFLFAADLIKEIKVPCELSFIKTSSYTGTESTGKITKLIGLQEDISGKDILLLDDIVDTGLTMEKVIEEVALKNPASITVATLLLKPDSFRKQFDVRYVGFAIPNDFVVGYGLDYDGYGRNFKDIYKLNG